jgi:hypothetical protein
MCGHVYMYHDLQQLQRYRPVWRCGTCGREAYVPLDCCVRPDFAPRQSVTLGRRCAQGLVAMQRWALTGLGALLGRLSRPAMPAVLVPDDNSAEAMAAKAIVVGADDGAETAVGAGVSGVDREFV